MYRPPDPEPDSDDDREEWLEPEPETYDLGLWLFSPIGAVLVWLVSLGLIIPAAGIALLLLPEDYGLLLFGFGVWLLLGLAVIHWWIPPGRHERRHSEGLAIAGWHILSTTVSTGFFAWLTLFQNGRRPVFTLADVYPVVMVGGILLIMFATILTLLRGYMPGRGLRYAFTLLCMLVVWMALWLVAAHGGLS